MSSANEFLGELLNHIVEDIKKGEKKVEVGKISDELRKKYKKWSDDKEYLKKEVETKKEILQSEMELQIYKEFNVAIREIEELKDQLWDEIEQELGLEDKDRRLTIDMKTGMIYDRVPAEKQKEKPKDLGEAMYEALKRKNRVQ